LWQILLQKLNGFRRECQMLDCGDLGYLRHGSIGPGFSRWPGRSRRELLDAMAGLARCL
jgi:hypothetical protein